MGLKWKLAMAVAGFTASAGVVAVGTLAMFTNASTSEASQFKAGTLTIADTTGTSAFQTALYVNNLAPGDSEDGVIHIKNAGTLDAFVSIKNVDTAGHGGGQHHGDHPENGQGPMSLFGGQTPLVVTFENNSNHPVLIPAGQTATLKVHYSMPLDAGNKYQGKPAVATFNVQAVQVRNNVTQAPTSWGNP